METDTTANQKEGDKTDPENDVGEVDKRSENEKKDSDDSEQKTNEEGTERKDDSDETNTNNEAADQAMKLGDVDIIDNTECKFNVNSFKLVYVINSESFLYKRMALKRAKEVSNF